MSKNLSRRDAVRVLIGGVAAFACAPRFAWADTQSDLDDAQAQADAVQAQLDEIASEAQALATQAEQTADQIEDLNSQISDTQSDIEDKEADLKEKQDRLAKRVSAAYKGGNADMLSILLSSSSFDELTSNIYYLDKISESDKAMIDDVKEAKAQLDEKKVDLESQKSNLEAQKEEQQAQLADMQANQAKVQETLDGLNEQVSELVAQRNEELAEQARQAELQKQAQAEAEAAAQSSSSSSSSGSSSSGSSSGGSSSSSSSSSSTSSSSSASSKGSAIVAACSRVGSPGAGLCAMWVSQVYQAAGCGYPGGNANDMYWNYCTSSDRSALQPGMIIAVPSHPHSTAGSIYGHVGIYIGNGTVMHNIGSIATWSLDSWISYYGASYTPRWGWA